MRVTGEGTKAARRWFWPMWLLATIVGLIVVVTQAVDLMGYSGQLVASIVPIKSLAVAGDNQVGQTFVAPAAGLERVDVLFFGFRRQNTQPITFHLRRQGEETDLVLKMFSASEVWGWRWKRFEFNPIPDSAAQAYVFFFDSPASTPADSIGLAGVRGDVYGQGTSFFLGVPADGDVAFKTFYAGVSLQSKLAMLADRLIAHKPGIWGDIRLYILLGAANLFLVVYLATDICRQNRQSES